MKHFARSRSTPAAPSGARRVIFRAVRAPASVGGVLVVISLALWPALAQADAGLPPGVHIDPGSPAAKEYVIPLSQARQTGAEGSSSSSAVPLFGAGIGPRGGGGSSRGAQGSPDPGPGARGASGAARVAGRGSAPGSNSSPAVARESLPSSVLASSSRASGDGGSLLALLAGGAAILILGGLGGAMLRRARHSTDTA
jgi:hypothetical protein